MLTVTRNVCRDESGEPPSRMNEVVVILEDGRRIIFRVHPASTGRVKVSIEAPRTVKVLRGEIDTTEATPPAVWGRRLVAS